MLIGLPLTYFHETYPTCFLLWLVTSLHEIIQLSNLFQLFQESQISGQMNLEMFWQFVLKLINYSWPSYPTRASYSGQVDGFRNPMKIELKTRPCLKRFHVDTLCTSQIEASTSPPPGQPPGICIFCKIFVQSPPSRGRKAVQMPHHRSIPGDQMPPPPVNFSVAFITLRKLCM